MDCHCIRHTELPNATKLFADFLYHFDRVAEFYSYNPSDPESFRQAAAQVDYPSERRAALVSVLRKQNGESPALDALARPGTVAVATGQQAGLFTGPAYTIYKAISAARLARELTALGITAVPIFWVATEDHDFEEVNHCWVFNAQCEPVRIEAGGNGSGKRPVGGIHVPEGPLDALREVLREFPFGDEVIAAAETAYKPGVTFGAAFAAMLRNMLACCGLLYFDPMQPEARELAAPLLARVVEAGPDLNTAVLARNGELESAGYHAQVHVEERTSFVFLLKHGRRIPLKRTGREYVANGKNYNPADLAAQADRLSPNALLRPVVQDYIFPTVAYVGGPAELAYLAQARVLYRDLLGRMPVCLHRDSFTVLDARAAKLMKRYGLSLRDFLAGEDSVRDRIARQLVPAGLDSLIGETRATTAVQLDRLGTGLMGFDRTLAESLEKSRRKIEYQLGKIELKIAREALRRNERAAREAAYVSGLVFPHRHLQERYYSILPLVAKHGPDFIERLLENAPSSCSDHRVLTL